MKRTAGIELGSWVRMKPAPGRDVDSTSRGRVVSMFEHRDFDGRHLRLEVRWISPDGEPDADTILLHPEEVEVIEEDGG